MSGRMAGLADKQSQVCSDSGFRRFSTDHSWWAGQRLAYGNLESKRSQRAGRVGRTAS